MWHCHNPQMKLLNKDSDRKEFIAKVDCAENMPVKV